MNILGISAFYHDSAAAILVDGDLVAAAQEERFSRVKFDARFPAEAIGFCLRQAGISTADLDFVVFYEKPLRKFERILLSNLTTFPRSWQVFRESTTAWFREKLWVKTLIQDKLRVSPDRILFVDHHLSHAASAMFCSPFERAAVLTVDGVGEWTTTALGRATADWGQGASNAIELQQEITFPHSLGLLYSAFTGWLGFKVNSGEYKVMGMAPYGQPRYLDKLEKLIRVHRDGSFVLDMDYFSFHHALSDTYGSKFVDLLGPARPPESPFFTRTTGDDIRGRESEADKNQYYADVAASVQVLTERILLQTVDHLHRTTGEKHLVLAGGVALNSVANGRIMRETPFEQVYIQPNAGDAGGALGAALYVWHVVLGKPRRFVMSHAYHGEAYAPAAIERFLRGRGIGYERVADPGHLADQLVDAILQKRVVGLFQGRFEWGPRALGSRSILADPRDASMKEVVNSKIKFRELFRPFAPVVTAEAAARYFDLGKAKEQYPQRFMLMVAPAMADREHEIPAVVHMGTARLQTVYREDNPIYHDVIERFGQATGVPVLLNTSFNLRGEPIVSSPADALNTFSKSDIDVLALGPFLVRKDAGRARSVAVSQVAGTSPGADAIVDGLVVCPACRGAVTSEATATGDVIACRACGRRFDTADGIPLMYWPTDESQIDKVSEIVQGFYEENPFPGYEDIDSADTLSAKARRGIFAQLLDDQVSPRATVLEVGCGTGQLSNFLGIRGRTVYGADLCRNSLRLAQQFRTRNQLDTVHFLQMNLFRPVFPDASFDLVISNGVLHHTDDPHGGFRSIATLVRPGGYIIIGLYNRYGRIWTDLRRRLFQWSGNRFQFLDGYLADPAVDSHKKRIWFADQYRHPHESKHSIEEVCGWFDEAGFDFMNAIPKPSPFGRMATFEPLLAPTPRGTAADHFLAELKLALTGGAEGGFFVMIGRRRA
jgi:carbamoyltransferase